LPLEVTLAVLGAALAHATWNAMIKSSRDVLLDMTLVVFFAGLVTAPFLPAVPLPPAAAWPYIAASMALHLVYYVALVGAYRAGDLSHGYPIMRGVAPLIVSVCALAWLGEAPTPGVWAGVLLICGGVLSLGFAGFRWAESRVSLGWALLNAVIIASYTLVDAAGARHTVLLEREPQRLRLKSCGALRANVGHVGYYRVQYDPRTFDLLARELPRLETSDRLRLLLDSFALLQAGQLDAGRYLSLVDALQAEPDPRVWEHVTEALRFLRELVDTPADQADFDAAIARVLRKPLARVGWDARPGEPADDALTRRQLIEALGRAGEADTLREARARFAARASKPIEAALRPALLNVVARHADEATFDAIVQWLRSATDADVKNDLRVALRSVSQPERLRRWLERLLVTDELAPGDAVYDITRSGQDSGQGEVTWQFVRANLPALLAKASPRGRAWVLPEAAQPSADAARADELVALTKQHLDSGAYYLAEKSADWIRLRAQVKSREAPRALRWARGILGT
jgi:aminopeptidase N